MEKNNHEKTDEQKLGKLSSKSKFHLIFFSHLSPWFSSMLPKTVSGICNQWHLTLFSHHNVIPVALKTLAVMG